MKDRLLALGIEVTLVDELEERQWFQRPAMSRGDRAQLFCGFRQRDVKAGFALANALKQELE